MKTNRKIDMLLLYYAKLFVRFVFFLLFLTVYIINRVENGIFELKASYYPFLILAYVMFLSEVVFRFFKSKSQPVSSQRQFMRVNEDINVKPSFKGVIFVVLIWALVTTGAGVLYYTGVIDKGILVLISLLYSVLDVVCVVLWCPFQSLFMKNKCCNTCRIHNWDMFLILTPLAFICNIFTYILVLLSLGVLVMWEVNVKKHPHSFCEETNTALRCKNCKEHTCRNKKSIKRSVEKVIFNKSLH